MWARATALVWLDFSFPIVFSWALGGTLRRILTQEVVPGGRETWRALVLGVHPERPLGRRSRSHRRTVRPGGLELSVIIKNRCDRGLNSADNCASPTSCHSVSLRMAPSPVPVTRDPEVLSGTACFAGTRVPVSALMDYLRGGERVDDFLDDFPTVSRDQVNAVLNLATEAASQHAHLA